MEDLEARTKASALLNRGDPMEFSMHDEEENHEVDMRNLPPLSSYVSGCRFWWHFALVPAAFVLANTIAFVSLVSFDENHMEMMMMRSYSYGGQQNNESDVWFAMYKTNSFMTAIILFADTILLYKAAVYMQRETDLLDVEVTGSNPGSIGDSIGSAAPQQQGSMQLPYQHVHAKVSRKLDTFLNYNTRRSGTSIFVSLLYVVTVLAGAGSLASIGVRIFASTATANNECSTAARRANQEAKAEPIEGIPDGLQSWAKGFLVVDGPNKSPADFLHLSDGRNFFSGHPTSMEDALHYYGVPNRVLVSVESNGSMVEHQDISNPNYLSVITSVESTATLFCGLYKEPAVNNIDIEMFFSSGSRAFCIAASDDLSHGVSNCTLAWTTTKRNVRHRRLDVEAATGYENLFWYLSRWHQYSSNRFGSFGRMEEELITEIYKVDPATMKVESVVNITKPYQPGYGLIIDQFGLSHGSCIRWFCWITSAVVTLVTFPGTYWLWKIKNLSAGVSPAVVGTIYAINTFNDAGAEVTCWIALLVTTVSLLGPIPIGFDREVAVWVHYSVISFLLGLSFMERYPIALICLAVGVGVILNHPVLQILGSVGGTAMTLLLFRFASFGSEYEFRYYMLSLLLYIFGACGMVSIGNALRKYHIYINYYTKRLWITMQLVVSDRSNQRSAEPNTVSRTGRDADLTRNLLD